MTVTKNPWYRFYRGHFLPSDPLTVAPEVQQSPTLGSVLSDTRYVIHDNSVQSLPASYAAPRRPLSHGRLQTEPSNRAARAVQPIPERVKASGFVVAIAHSETGNE